MNDLKKIFQGYINDENANSGHLNNWQDNGQNRGQYQHNDGQGPYNGGQGRYEGPKRRETIDFKCFNIGEEKSDVARDNLGCAQVFDSIETANLACSLFEKCRLIGQNSDGNFVLFSESDDNTVTDLENFNLSIPSMDKTKGSLIYGNSYNDNALSGFLKLI